LPKERFLVLSGLVNKLHFVTYVTSPQFTCYYYLLREFEKEDAKTPIKDNIAYAFIVDFY
jgi:hypothetical protein